MSEENKNQRQFTNEALEKISEQKKSSRLAEEGAKIAGETGQPLFWSPGKEIAEMEAAGQNVIPFPGQTVPNATMHQIGPGDPVSAEDMPQEEPTPPTPSNIIAGGGNRLTSELASLATQDDDEKNAKDYEGLCKLPYIELYTRRSRVISDLKDLKSSKQMMDQVGDTFADASSDEAKAIAQANQLDTAQIKKSADEFYAEYPNLIHEGQRLLDLMDSMLETYPETCRKSTTFISKSMVESANIRRESLLKAEDKSPNYGVVLKRLDVVTAAYADRTNFDPLLQKLKYPHNIRKLYKEFVALGPDKVMAAMDKTLMPVFNDNHMTKFRRSFERAIMTEKMDAKNTSVLVFFMTYWLAMVYDQEFSSGKCAYVKTFIMNFYDMASQMYDCDYGPGYMALMGQSIFSLVSFAATADIPKKQLSSRYDAIYDTMMSALAGARNTWAPKPVDDDNVIPDQTSLIEMYPNLDYQTFRREREIIEDGSAAPNDPDEDEGAQAPTNDDTETPGDDPQEK